MQVWILSYNPVTAAHSLCDQHVGKAILESAQMMSAVAHLRRASGVGLYKLTHANHPCIKWLVNDQSAWSWLWMHTRALAREHHRRFNKSHASASVFFEAYRAAHRTTPLPPALHSYVIGWNQERFPLESDEDTVTAYRRYYINKFTEWASRDRPMKWTHCEPPRWIQQHWRPA